jgi:hypothetical protein
MSIQSVNLPINIPWKLVAASRDMMDTQFNNVGYPHRGAPLWQSMLMNRQHLNWIQRCATNRLPSLRLSVRLQVSSSHLILRG